MLLLIALPVMASEEVCEQYPMKEVFGGFLGDVSKINDALYVKVMDLKVNYDGSGSLSVFYDQKGEPQLIKLKYKNKSGNQMEKVLTFQEISDGKALEYENKEIPGKAIIVGKGEPFKAGEKFNFKVSVRSKLKPVSYNEHVVSFSGPATAPQIVNNDRKFGTMILSPGTSFLSWDGTFNKVEFK